MNVRPLRSQPDPLADDGPLANALLQGMRALSLDHAPGTVPTLLRYLRLLSKWNRVYNLSAIREPELMLTHHLLDSLAVLPVLRAAAALDQSPVRLLDVGSGAGLPGLPLALVWSDLQVHLVEPVGKKAAFLRQSALELALTDRVVVHADAIEHLPPIGPAHVICRAFASLPDYVVGINAQVQPSTRVWAMKGRYPGEEIAGLPLGWQVCDAHVIHVPGLDAERHLIELSRIPTHSVEQ